MRQHYLPEFYLPFPAQASHPLSDELEAEAYAWARDRGLVDDAGYRRLAASRVVTAGTGYYDRGDRERMAVLARWYVWLVLIDDYFDDTPVKDDPAAWEQRTAAFAADLVAALSGQEVTREATGEVTREATGAQQHGSRLYEATVRELWPRTAARMSDSWRRRFIDHLRAFLEACRWHARVRHGVAPAPTQREYVAYRRRSFGGGIFYDMIDMVEGQELPEAFYAGQTWRELAAASSDAMAWTNDIFSLPKDLADGERANLVLLVREQRGGDWRRCVDEVNAMVSERLRDFLRARAELPATIRNLELGAETLAQAELRADRIAGAVHAALECHLRSARYPAAR